MQLHAQVQTLREANERLAERVGRLETREAVQSARAAPAASPAAPDAAATPTESPADHALPPLTVVKLRPKRAPAPKLATDVAVVEPEPDDVEAFVQASAPAAPEREAPDVDPALLDAAYERAVAGLRTGDVENSAAALRRFAEENPRHPRADNALYLAGLGLAGLKEWAQAAELFERLMASYPAGDTVLDAMLRLAECRSRLQQPDAARALYTRVVTQFPGTAAATQAEQRLAALSK